MTSFNPLYWRLKRIALCLPLVAAAVMVAAPVAAQPNAATQSQPVKPDEPTSLSAQQQASVNAILAPYKPATLTAEDAKVIKRSLRDAGMRRSLVLDKAITAAGFSPERLEALDPRPAQPPPGADTAAPANAPPRK